MNTKMRPAYDFPTSQQVISVIVDGKSYGVCSEQEMKDALEYERQRLKHFEPTLTAEEVENRIEQFRAGLDVITLSWVYKNLSQDEIKNFEESYRFSGVTRVWK